MKKNTLVLAALLALPHPEFAPRGGEEVRVTLIGGFTLKGEILMVRDSTIYLWRDVGASTEEIARRSDEIARVRYGEIAGVEKPGTSYVVVGIGLGMAAGCLVGCATFEKEPYNPSNYPSEGSASCESSQQKYEEDQTSKQNGRAAQFGLGGAVLGGIIGAVASNTSESYVTPQNRNFTGLENLARYRSTVPDFLKEKK